ncbi:MAG: hypothetical protein ACYCT9_12100 [Leptospirillum sp.]
MKKTWEIEDFFWWDFERLGIFPRWIEVLGDRVRVSDGTAEVRVPVGVLSAGISVVLKNEGKRYPPIPGRPFGRQIGYLTWKGRRA